MATTRILSLTYLRIMGCISLMLAAVAEPGTVNLNNELCRPRPTVVATDHPNFRHFPFYVTLHRCSGSWNTLRPSQWRCVANKTTDVMVKVLSISTSTPFSDGTYAVKMKNHTSCAVDCATKPSDCKYWETYDKGSCMCSCLHAKAPVACGPKKYWNTHTCSCECIEKSGSCRKKKLWSDDKCDCVCEDKHAAACAKLNKVLDSRTCGCKEPRIIRIGTARTHKADAFGTQSFWYYVVIGEFVVLMMLFDTVLFFKKSGMIYALSRKCRSKEHKPVPTIAGDVSAFDNCCICKTAHSSLVSLDDNGQSDNYLNPNNHSRHSDGPNGGRTKTPTPQFV